MDASRFRSAAACACSRGEAAPRHAGPPVQGVTDRSAWLAGAGNGCPPRWTVWRPVPDRQRPFRLQDVVPGRPDTFRHQRSGAIPRLAAPTGISPCVRPMITRFTLQNSTSSTRVAATSARGISRCGMARPARTVPVPGPSVSLSGLRMTQSSDVGLPRFGYCWRSRQAAAGAAMRRTKADWRVRSRGVPASQLLRRPRLMAAAVSTCCRWVLASPM